MRGPRFWNLSNAPLSETVAIPNRSDHTVFTAWRNIAPENVQFWFLLHVVSVTTNQLLLMVFGGLLIAYSNNDINQLWTAHALGVGDIGCTLK